MHCTLPHHHQLLRHHSLPCQHLACWHKLHLHQLQAHICTRGGVRSSRRMLLLFKRACTDAAFVAAQNHVAAARKGPTCKRLLIAALIDAEVAARAVCALSRLPLLLLLLRRPQLLLLVAGQPWRRLCCCRRCCAASAAAAAPTHLSQQIHRRWADDFEGQILG